MGFLKNLFSAKEESAEEREQKRQENDFDVLKYDGIQAMQIGRLTYAIACFTHALNIKDDTETRVYLANAYMRNDDLESAAEEFEHLSKLHPDETNYVANHATILYELEEYNESTSLCEILLEKDNSLAYPSFLLGKINKALGNLDEAERHVSDAIDKRDNFVDALLLRSDIRYEKKDYEGALSDIDTMLSNNYDAEEVLMQKGMVLAAMGNVEDAITYYNNVLDQNPFIPEAYGRLALIHIQSGDYASAEAVLSDGIEQNGETSGLISIRAELKDATGDSAGAEADRNLSEQLKIEEEEQENEDYDVEREMKERMSAVNPFQ